RSRRVADFLRCTSNAVAAMRTIGILGGTFDPIHYGHLRLAAEVRAALGLAHVLLIPARDPPHRAAPLAPAEARFAMVELGCAEFPGLIADARELNRAGPSYTVTTLQSLHKIGRASCRERVEIPAQDRLLK